MHMLSPVVPVVSTDACLEARAPQDWLLDQKRTLAPMDHCTKTRLPRPGRHGRGENARVAGCLYVSACHLGSLPGDDAAMNMFAPKTIPTNFGGIANTKIILIPNFEVY